MREDTPTEYSFVNIDMDESTVALLGRYSGEKTCVAVWLNVDPVQCLQALQYLCGHYADCRAWSPDELWIGFTYLEQTDCLFNAADAQAALELLRQ